MVCEWNDAIKFRDALRTDTSLREKYLLAKEQAIENGPKGRAIYNKLKSKFFGPMGG